MRSTILRHLCPPILAVAAFLGLPRSAPAQQSDHWRTISLEDSRAVVQEPRRVDYLDVIAADSAAQARVEVGQGTVAEDEIYVSIIDYRDSHDPRMGSYRGAVPVYPASVVKMCYMVAAYDQARTGRLELDAEVRDHLNRMIVVSDNAATSHVLNLVTNTTSGPELEGAALASFVHKRYTVNRYMQSLGLDGLHAVNKTYGGSVKLFGRDIPLLGGRGGDHFENSNSMTTDDTARLLYLIWRRAVVDAEACQEMLSLMKRSDGSRSVMSGITPEDATLYSKDGFTSLERHDAGIFDFGDDGAIIVVVFTVYRGDRTDVVPRTAEIILEKVRATPAEMGVGSDQSG